MVLIVYLFLLAILNIAISQSDDGLLVKYISEVVVQEQAKAHKFEVPEDAYQYKADNQTLADYGTFDYIIVGAGSSGAVLATRLSEDENSTILLLEAGGEPTTFSDIPSMFIYLQGLKFNWNYRSVPQKTCCLGMIGHRCPHPRGKALGGSSVINALMYVRGNKHDFDSWARAGNKGWSYEEVLPYFMKSENSQIDGDPGYHGKGGLLNVEYHKPPSPVLDAFLQANQQKGRKILDYNGKEQIGAARVQINTIRGRRDHTARAFLSMAADRKNLKIVTNSYAKKVLIAAKKNAYGVVFDYKGQAYSAKTNKEVILSAGAIGSPHLLMLSGIGPLNVLKPLGVPTVADLPVGENYQNHPTFYALFFTTNYSEPIKSVSENSREFVNGYGQYTIGANSQGLAFLRTKSAKTPNGVPNIEIIVVPQFAFGDFIQQTYNFDNESYNTYWPKVNASTTFCIHVILLHPKSRGTVRLRSPDPYKYPDIDTNFFSDKDDEDLEQMYEGINLVRELMDTPAFRKLDAQLFYQVLPACRDYEYMSKEQWFCQLRQISLHLYHPVGTCKMGPNPNLGGVVNYELKVHGIEKLRVVDASIIPDAPSGHTNAPAIMIAEKMADILMKPFIINDCRKNGRYTDETCYD